MAPSTPSTAALAGTPPPLRLLQRWVPDRVPGRAPPAGWAAVAHALRQLILPR